MSSTNKTNKLKLPQWIDTDKPSFLGDLNKAMLDIDDGVADVGADANSASVKADTAKTTADTAVTSAVTADTKATQAQTSADLALSRNETLTGRVSANEMATANVKTYAESIPFINFTNFITVKPSSINTGSALEVTGSMTIALTDNNDFCKVYSDLLFTNNSATQITITNTFKIVPIGTLPTRTDSFYYHSAGMQVLSGVISGESAVKNTRPCRLRFETDGSIEYLTMRNLTIGVNEKIKVSLFPCIVQLKDFGDISTL